MSDGDGGRQLLVTMILIFRSILKCGLDIDVKIQDKDWRDPKRIKTYSSFTLEQRGGRGRKKVFGVLIFRPQTHRLSRSRVLSIFVSPLASHIPGYFLFKGVLSSLTFQSAFSFRESPRRSRSGVLNFRMPPCLSRSRMFFVFVSPLACHVPGCFLFSWVPSISRSGVLSVFASLLVSHVPSFTFLISINVKH